ncbi:MAG: hypothetical protein JTT14_00245 [Candidatus Brockarchaeota archaeon]|nr:hypothetical protein [Candidatus Brockarchaeota archaeon]
MEREVNGRNLVVSYKDEKGNYKYSPEYIDKFINKYTKLLNSHEKFKDITAIYIVGAHKSGKSHLARYLKSKLPDSYLLSFARPMKLELYRLFGKEFIENKSPEARLLLQAYGEAKRAQTDGNYFVKVFYNVLAQEKFNIKYVLVDDVYHLNERLFLNLFPKKLEILFKSNPSFSPEELKRVSLKELSILMETSNPDVILTPQSTYDDILEKIQAVLTNK